MEICNIIRILARVVRGFALSKALQHVEPRPNESYALNDIQPDV